LNLQDQVRLMGQVSDDVLAALYHGCDIFCVPSVTERDERGAVIDHEGIPEVLKEAMMYGKPVVATRHTGIPEAASRCLVDENDIEGLAGTIAELLDNPQLRQEIGSLNRARAEELYSNDDLSVLRSIFCGE